MSLWASRDVLEHSRRSELPVLPECTCADIAQSVAIVVEVCARFVDFAHIASSAAAADDDVY